MKTRSKVAVAAALLLAASATFASGVQAQTNVLIGNATANDTQAAANDKLGELMTKYSNGRLKASARHGQSLGNNAQMLAALQAGSVAGMILPAGFISSTVPELSLFDLPFLLPGAPAKITAFAAQSKAAVKMMELAAAEGHPCHRLPRHRSAELPDQVPGQQARRHPGQEVPRHSVAAARRRLPGLGRGAAADGIRRGLHRPAAGHARRHGEPARRHLQDEAARGGEVLHHHRALRLRVGRHRQQALARRAAQGPAGRGAEGRQGDDRLRRRRLYQVAGPAASTR